MASRNDITGDAQATKGATDAYRDGWDRIFGKKKKAAPEPVAQGATGPTMPETYLEIEQPKIDLAAVRRVVEAARRK